ncbi:methylamine utilization protein [uncultured Methylibium sp.]|uniref:methylamine utilization protein n=1 Tax=uncultured Methylibium sp. TaxID=381093 RepID=UPI0025CFE1E4|nr:methylamine utilization protein [uncultured Methylibium sp.]
MQLILPRPRRFGLLAALCALGGSAIPAIPSQAVPLTVIVNDENGQPLANAVVSIQVQGAAARAATSARAELAQRGKRFVPSVLVVQTGTAVQFPNFDTVRHHVYSFSQVKTFELKLYAGTPTAPIVFDKAGTAILGCNIHDKMSAHVRVVDTPYFATTDANGRAQIDLPPGEHTLSTWHPGLAAELPAPSQPVRIGSDAAKLTVRLKAS